LLPMPYELGLDRLRREFGLVPVEYPTTRAWGSTPRERAADLNAAFADPEIRAVIATIGGEDQITVLPHLDRELIRAHPKPFFGYSDNTNLLLFLRNLGVVSYHGGSVMVELGRPGALHPRTADSLRAALFGSGPYELTPSADVGDVNGRWETPETFAREPVMEPGEGWFWHNADRVVTGAGWGGCLEILAWMLMADREILPVEEYDGQVLFLETSEEMPGADEVYRILRNMGERGLLRRFPAVLMARALANELALGAAPPERAGSAAAVLESGAELGGALGMALLGALGAAVYTDAVPASAPAAARETLGGALTTGPEVVEAARTAFVEAMGAVAVGAAVLMAASAALSLVLLRRARG
ncbi:LD-carboxypeptidase, partial [Streptomyces massasporeus]